MDERLRDLERAARARPGDSAAAWAYVRALEQVGQGGVARWGALCRLARSGDDEAWCALELQPAGAGRLEVTGHVDLENPVYLSGQGAGRLALMRPARSKGVLEVLDARTLAVSWRVEADGLDVAVTGPRVAHRSPDPTELVVRELHSGVEVGRTPLECSLRLQAAAGRAVAFLRDTGHICVIDMSDAPGTVLWRGDMPRGDLARDRLLGGVRAWYLDRVPRMTAAFALGELAPAWEVRGWLRRADSSLAVLLRWDGERTDLRERGPACARGGTLVALDVVTGAERWTHVVEHEGWIEVRFTRDHVIAWRPDRVEALDRRTGAPCWSVPVPAAAEIAVEAASDVVYVVAPTRPGARKHRVVATALDARDGAVRGECAVLERSARAVRLLAVPHAVIVLADLGRAVRLIRAGEP